MSKRSKVQCMKQARAAVPHALYLMDSRTEGDIPPAMLF